MAYSREVRRKARRMYLTGMSAEEVAEKLGINPDTIYRWKREERWDEEIDDESIEGLRKRIRAIIETAEEEGGLTDAQARKIEKLTKALERLERMQGRKAKGRRRRKQVPGLSIEVVGDIKTKILEMFYPYQREFVMDNSRFRIVLKSRQIGFSFTIAAEAILGALERKEDQIVVSASRAQSGIVRRYVLRHLEKLGIEYLEDKDALILPGGKRIYFLPCNPRTVQGYSGDVYLDEFAWHLRPGEMWMAVVPSVTVGKKRLTVLSTPYTEYDRFGEVFTNEEQYPRFKRYRLTIYDAVRQGLPVDIEELRSLFDEVTWRQAYECEFFTDETALLTVAEVRDAFDDGALGPIQDWGYGGMDIGRYKDLTAIVLVEEDKERVVWLRYMKTLLGKAFREQKEFVSGLFESYRIKKFSVDATGLGLNLAEDLQRMYGGKVEKVWFTRERKEEMALGVKRLFEERRIRIPNDRDLVMQLHAIKRKATATGFSYDADRNERVKHADLFWALALAVKHVSGLRKRLIDKVRIF